MNFITSVLVIGGGPAGLSAALALGRQLHHTVLFDSGIYRNAAADNMHNFVSWDHEPPTYFRAKARENLVSRYSEFIRIENTCVTSLKKNAENFFEAQDANGRVWLGKKVILAMGSTDLFPDTIGYQDCWAYGIFHCLYCHGFEELGSKSVGILAIDACAVPEIALHLTQMAGQLTNIVTIYTNGNHALAETLSAKLETEASFKISVRINSTHIVRLTKTDAEVARATKNVDNSGRVNIHFEDGTTAIEGFLVHSPKTKLSGMHLIEQLGLEVSGLGDLSTSLPFLQTSLHGVFAAGDCMTSMKSVASAVSNGCLAGVGAGFQLNAEKHGTKSMV
ncbi:hypothetical protein HK100_008367 [Physocladia obscura]|uniref:FAD/NAD(P)-binding domain-containing protein n=1 Tax=Physocladia obscura TaxID=109957 RepID=A0AAD5XI03_9FUNG|nr:hypothetical protein HK100_008367 [Physocladia obscura]